MTGVGYGELVAAVANAGALGFITAHMFKTGQELFDEIEKTRKLTKKPFGVNLTLLPSINPIPYDEYREAIIASGIKIVETAGRAPTDHLPRFKENGVKVIHKCTSVRHSVSAVAKGVDVISIDGFECAGHPGEDDVGLIVLLPATVDAVDVPVLHIADAVGEKMKAAGAVNAALIGTRNVMTESFYRRKLVSHGIDLLPPDMSNVDRTNEIIYEELMRGKASRNAERFFRTMITNLEQAGAKAIVLACTELDMVIDVDANVLPIFDSARIHSEAVVDWILER